MDKVSIIIPSRNEQYLNRTLQDIFAKATGDYEVIVVLDGPTDYPLVYERPNLTYLHKEQAEGLRPALRDAAQAAGGKYLLKLDAHSAVSPGFDEALQEQMEDDWVVVSRFYNLDTRYWEPVPDRVTDYFYLSCPWTVNWKTKNTGRPVFIFRTTPWESRRRARQEIAIDDQMCIQASLWMMTKDHFLNFLGGLDDQWGSWSCEQNEIALKTWLGGGRVIVNKNVWNAHYWKPNTERVSQYPEYTRNRDTIKHVYFARYWLKNKWEGQVHDFDWLVDKFWPLPTENCHVSYEKHLWPDNWRETYEAYQ